MKATIYLNEDQIKELNEEVIKLLDLKDDNQNYVYDGQCRDYLEKVKKESGEYLSYVNTDVMYRMIKISETEEPHESKHLSKKQFKKFMNHALTKEDIERHNKLDKINHKPLSKLDTSNYDNKIKQIFKKIEYKTPVVLKFLSFFDVVDDYTKNLKEKKSKEKWNALTLEEKKLYNHHLLVENLEYYD